MTYELWLTIGLIAATPAALVSIYALCLGLTLLAKAYVTDTKYKTPKRVLGITPPTVDDEDALLFGVFIVFAAFAVATCAIPPLVLIFPVWIALRIIRFAFRTKKRIDKVLASGKCLKDYREDNHAKSEF